MQFAIIFVALWAVFGCAVVCYAQADKAVGGLRKADKNDEGVVAAANFAVEKQAQKDASLKLISIESAERQIVAGSKYSICMVVNSGGATQQATAVVFTNLQNQSKLMSWTPGKCPDNAAASPTPSAERQITPKDFAGIWEAGGDLNKFVVNGKVVQRVLTELAESTVKNFEIKVGDVDFVGVIQGNVVKGTQILYMFPEARQRCPGLSSTRVSLEFTMSADGKTFNVLRDDPIFSYETCQWTLEGRERVAEQMNRK